MGEVGQEWASVENSLGLAGGLTDGIEIGGKNDRSGGGKREGEGTYMGSLSWLVGGGSAHNQIQSQGLERTPERISRASSALRGTISNGDKEGLDGKNVGSHLHIPLFHLFLCTIPQH